jgi:O-antigen ligase
MIYQHHWLHIARAKGFWKNPNPAAISIEIFLPTIIAYMCSRRVSRTFSGFVFIFSVLPMSLGLIASQSRGAWIVSVLVVGIMLVLQRNWRYILGAIGVGCGLVIAYYPIILERAKQTVNMNYSANFERINAWVSSIRIMKENWLGIGFGNFSEIYPQYMLEGAREPLTHAHNIILEFGVSGGPLMAFSFMAFIFFVSRFIARTMTWNDFSTTPMYQGLTFGAIAFIIHGVIDFPLTARIEMWGVFMFMVGLLIGLLCHGQYESNKLYGELI